MNLVSTILTLLTPMLTNRIASALGMNNAVAKMAIAAIVPSLLAALAGKASTPSGASALTSLLGQQDPALLGSLGTMLEGGGGQSGLIANGSSALTSLLGGSSTSALAGAVSKFAGVDSGASSNFVSLLAPVVMGQLAQTQRTSGLDASGVANLLASQKDNIAAALPPGFASLLKGTGLLDSVADNLAATGSRGPDAMPERPSTPDRPSMPKMPDMPAFDWTPWALGLAGILGLYWLFLRPNPVTIPPPPANQTTISPTASPSATITSADAMKQAASVLVGLSSTLGSIKDTASAQAAVPSLTAASTTLDGLAKAGGTLAPDARAQLASVISGAMPQLAPLVANVLKVPGAEAILKPILDAIMAKLIALGKV